MRHIIQKVWIVCAPFASMGCTEATPGGPARLTHEAGPSMRGWEKELIHDFGRVEPNRDMAHAFQVSNPTNRPWILKNIHQSCSCSIATASTDIIQPGAAADFEFQYHTPGGYADERRWIDLRFDGEPPHEIKLIVTAMVRPRMTPRPAAVNFGNIPARSAVVRGLELGNFGDADWSRVEIADKPKWLTLLDASRPDST